MADLEDTLAARLQRLEDIEAIRRLKARYLNACDQKDRDGVRACFTDGAVTFDTAHLGLFTTADDFVAMYAAAALHDHVLDKHQAGNAEIEIIDHGHARGLWCLDYRNINLRDRTLTLMSVIYHDSYEKMGGTWKISASRSEFKTALHCSYATGTLEALIAGQSVADPPIRLGRAA
jgi:ketosteroid isomerase-like protein